MLDRVVETLQATQGYVAKTSDHNVTTTLRSITTRSYVPREVYAKPHRFTTDSIDVVLESDRPYHQDELEDMYDEFDEVFNEFGKLHKIYFHKRNLERDEKFPHQGLSMAKYGVRGADCLEFQQFLLELRPQKYHLKYAHVDCGRMSFSICLAFSCPKDDFHFTSRYMW
ncbi:hypothetical protein Aduo_012680 [Ancylostoma duodenale]